MALSTLTLNVSADSYQGNPQFVVRVDGIQYGGIFTASAPHSSGLSEQVQITGDFSSARQVMVEYLYDLSAGDGLDRNLFVDSISFDSQSYNSAFVVIDSPKGAGAEFAYKYNSPADLYFTNSKAIFNVNGFDGSFIIDPEGFGSFTFGATSAGGTVYALYEGLLGRAPDVSGLAYWANQLEHGSSARDLGQLLLASPEGQSRAGALDPEQFVTQLYQTTLGRAPDADGLTYWSNQLKAGVERIDVASNFVFSAEHLSSLKAAFDAGIFVPDEQAADVARLYYAMLGRAPDAGGLQYWANQLDQGGSISDLAKAFLGTPENQSKYGALSNEAYVDALYVNALGRNADADGLKYWADRLNQGTSQADLAVLLSDSPESHSVHLAQIELGWHLA